MTVQEIRELMEEYGVTLTAPVHRRYVGSIPLQNEHKVDVYAPAAIVFSKKEADKLGEPCYVITEGAGRWNMVYTAAEADIGFVGNEEETADRLAEYILRNWTGQDENTDSFIQELRKRCGKEEPDKNNKTGA